MTKILQLKEEVKVKAFDSSYHKVRISFHNCCEEILSHPIKERTLDGLNDFGPSFKLIIQA